ncbi:MAG: bifunctional 5,10-methylenetetrahydrofolate dehydrogenase/5,10-methenyltetrahydrofolate cyclohydrolase [Thermoproteota archaeon]|nr:bifunctional 5,10-methylenetetrahydrofolate dehydrogenase/5,10-methenyltetrahydrofolate cyclohydrolase [Thermoproteota archaeon]
MTAKILDGLLVSQSIKKELADEILKLNESNVYPCLATILVGNDPASISYISNKQKTAKSVGIKTLDYRLNENISHNDLSGLIDKLNKDKDVHGILIQLPLQKHLDKFVILNLVDPNKDVDGLTFLNSGLLLNSKSKLIPCTPLGVMTLFDYYNIDLDGATVSIINRSNLVGKPLSSLLLERNSTVVICHSHTKNLDKHLQYSDIIITAVGNRAKFKLTKNMVKDNSIIIDIGTSRVNGKLLGDVDFDDVKEKASYITPVPGGVGPMTIAMLLRNTVQAAKIINSFNI